MSSEHEPGGIARERERRARTIQWLEKHGAAEGRDWCWGTAVGWDNPGVVDTGLTVEVQERLVPKDKSALPLMIRSTGVRMIGGRLLAAAMDEGQFPAEMPFAVGRLESLS